MKLHTQLLLALAGGLTAGALAHAYGNSTAVDFVAMHLLRPIGQIFLRTIFMIVVPMVFAALVVGVYDLGQEHGLGTIVRRTLAFTLLLSTTSVALGMGVVNLVRPGAGMAVRLQDPPAGMPPGQTPPAPLPEAKHLSDVLIELVPRNPLGSAVQALDGEMLPLMVFAVIFGLAVSGSRAMRPERHLLVRVLDEVFDACMRVVGFAMRFAPVAVFAIVFNTARTFGAGVFYALLLYVATVVLGLLLQQVFVYGALLRLVARRSPARFFRECRDVYLYAFSTASSNATLPLALQTAETRLGLSPQISRFVLTIGSTANQNGTALFEGVTVLFLAQAYGLDLSPGQQVRVMVMSIVAGVGTAGVPGGSLPMVMIVAQSVGVPAEGLALILGVDRFLDMCRTAVNVSGDLVIAALVNTHDSEHGHREHH